MKLRFKSAFAVSLLLAFAGRAATTNIVLEVSKDTFARSNDPNRNSGASEQLLIAHNPMLKTLIGFDLSAVTNEIQSAELIFHIKNTMPQAVSVVIAPMVRTENNLKWEEGKGALGTKGQNARIGEASYLWSYFRDVYWETAPGVPAEQGLLDPRLWGSPIARLNNMKWEEGELVTVEIDDIGLLKEAAKSKQKTVTFGIWGTSGNGLYAISSKESGSGAKLNLTVKTEDKKAQK